MIQFAHPEIALLFMPWLFLVIWNTLKLRKMNRNLDALGSERVRWYILGRIVFSRQRTRNILYYTGLALLIISAIGPKVGTRVVELKRKGVDVLFIIDTSISMDATDVKPSRLDKAKYEASRLIAGLRGDRVGMIVFAGSAHLHFPLTSDYAAARLFLNSIDTKLVQLQGTVIADALELAIETFDATTEMFKTVVIFSDGEDHDGRAVALAKKAAESGIIIHTVGVGTAAGAPIPLKDEQTFKKDRSGRVVTSVLNETMLSDIAEAGNGTYARVTNRTGGLDDLLEEILDMEKRTLKTHEFSQFENRYQLFLFPALICFLLNVIIPGGRSEAPKLRSRYA